MQPQFIAAINQLCDEKNLPRDVVLETVKAALRAAYRKDYGTREQNIDVDLDEKSGNITVYMVKEVVKKVENEDQQMTVAESYGRHPSQAQIDMFERMASYFVYIAPLLQLASFLLGALVVAAIAWAIFNAALGGDASFRQVFSVVAHSSVVLALQSLFTMPLDYARETLSSPTNLAIFLPFLDETTFPARLLGSIELFVIWWTISLAIGLGVLYRRRTVPIAASMLAVYAVIALVVATLKSVLGGA